MPSAVGKTCPVCLGSSLVVFLERNNVPVFQNVLYKYRKDALNIDRGSLHCVACATCGFVFNAAFDPAKTQYDRHYDNNQTCSAEFSSYLDGHIRRLAGDAELAAAAIVEVGCGNGWFLEHLVSAMPASRGFGFDPAYRGAAQSADGRIHYVRRYFEGSDAALEADVVVCRHVIEHVADPVGLLVAVRAALSRSQRPHVFFETPSVTWILRNQVFWDFFYEHCSYFNPASLSTAFERAGFRVQHIDSVFGGQYMWLEATTAPSGQTFGTNTGNTVALAEAFAKNERQLRDEWTSRLVQLKKAGNVAVWGAGAKGVTFLNVIDPHAELVDCAVDISPDKQGLFVGGTGHPVVGPSELGNRGVTSAILMNPNYRDENLRLLQAARTRVELVS